MLHLETITEPTYRLLKAIQSERIFDRLRLVGGTSLALQYGHRKSIDLDFFGTLEADTLEVQTTLNEIGITIKEKDSKNIKVFYVNGVKVDMVNYS